MSGIHVMTRGARMMSAVLTAAAAPSIGLLALTAPAASASTSSQVGWIQLANLSPNTPAGDVYLYSFGDSKAQQVIQHVTYGTVSAFEALPAGDYTVAMRAAGAPSSSKPVLSTAVDILAGHAYTVAGMGPFKALRLQVMRDRLSTPSGKALVQVIQASLQQHQVTISAGRTVLASKLPFGTATSFITV